jgi:hypothetical protein
MTAQNQLKGGDRVICVDPNHPQYHRSGVLHSMTVNGEILPLWMSVHWDDDEYAIGYYVGEYPIYSNLALPLLCEAP